MVDVCVRVGDVQFQRVGAQRRFRVRERGDQRAVPVHGDGESGAARDRLERQRAGPGEKVEASFARQVLPQPVEQGLANTIGGRPQALGGREAELPPAPEAADDTNAIRVGRGQGDLGAREVRDAGIMMGGAHAPVRIPALP